MKRLKWKDDKPATVKQLDFAKSLLVQIKGLINPPDLAKSVEEQLAVMFWQKAEIPDDLTFTEARKLLDDMIQYRDYRSYNKLPHDILEAIIKRHSGDPINAGYPAIMYTSVFYAACEPLEFYMQKQGAIE